VYYAREDPKCSLLACTMQGRTQIFHYWLVLCKRGREVSIIGLYYAREDVKFPLLACTMQGRT
jgi:hypothetical protein